MIETLNQILLDKLCYDVQLSEHTLMSSQKFREYWQEFCQSTDDNFRLDNVLDYAQELGYNGEFGENPWD